METAFTVQHGVDFVGFFEKDNFTARRTTGHNMFDPESFITGAELEHGFTYSNSARTYPSFEAYVEAVTGVFTPAEIETKFPRKLVEEVEVSAEDYPEEEPFDDYDGSDDFDEYQEEMRFDPYAGSIDPYDS